MTDKTDLPKLIYLIPDGDGYVWCEDPAPGVGMEEKDAVKYLSTAAFIEQACEAIDESKASLENPEALIGFGHDMAKKAIRDRFNAASD